ncbi:MAG TPA: hypothetical protein ENJ07_01365, partial [Gammaproteobacteria bacterium]|nr:hypothetical protein [Gammaproteobacteria bacterium]
SALYRGMEVTPHYDSMLGKLITWGRDREQARRRLVRALRELHIGPVIEMMPIRMHEPCRRHSPDEQKLHHRALHRRGWL